MIFEFYSVGVVTGLIALIYLCFFYNINWIRDLTNTNPKSASLTAKYRTHVNRRIKNLPPVYPNGWFGLVESRKLKNGQVKHVAALGQNFAVFRTDSGIARVVDAFCPHLGANMAEGGRVIGEELECHFHSWRFCGESGKCTAIPYTKTVPSNIKVKVWDSVEVNEVIFVWYHAENLPPYWWPEQVEAIAKYNMQYQGRNEFYINCHIQEIPENGADWAHLGTIHSSAMLPMNLFSNMMHHKWTNISWSTKSSVIQSETSDETFPELEKKDRHIALVNLDHCLVLFNKFSILQLKMHIRQIGPGYVEMHLQSSFGSIFIVQTITPLQPLIHRVTHSVYAPRYMSPYAKIILIAESIMFERDALVWNHKKYMHNPLLVSEEKPIKNFRRWFQQFYSENSPTYESCITSSLDW